MFFFLVILLKLTTEIMCYDQNPYLDALQSRQWKSVQNYIEVRPGAFLFYWLYYADGTHHRADLKPLIIWIQGGPGIAASGVGNFAEIGPINMNMQPRNHTWVNGRNVLFIDHPVGTGFSYATNDSLLVRSDKDAAKDLLRAIKAFFRRHKQFRKTPTYLFGQSYGGKLCPRLGYYLHKAIEKKHVKVNLKGIGIGSGWVDPKESTLAQSHYLYYMGVIDVNTYEKTKRLVKKLCHYIDRKEYVFAEKLDDYLFELINKDVGMLINFNNVNQVSPYPALEILQYHFNEYIKPTLTVVNQNLDWTYLSESVFQSLNASFLIPSTSYCTLNYFENSRLGCAVIMACHAIITAFNAHLNISVEMILNNTRLKVAIYNGNLDIVTPLAGATNWVHKLKWPGADEFKNTKRTPIRGYKNGFYKTARQLSYWSVFGAGHWVPEDNPEAMAQILEYIMS